MNPIRKAAACAALALATAVAATPAMAQAWPGKPITAHWGIEDPAAVEGEGQREAFVDALRYLRRRIELFLALPISSLDDMTIAAKLMQIGREDGATGLARE